MSRTCILLFQPWTFRLLALSLLAAFTANARVFEKRVSGPLTPEIYVDLGWQQVYKAPILIDGQEADVQMWQSSEAPHQALASLEVHCLNRGIPSGFFSGNTMGWGLSAAGGDLIKHLVFSADNGRSTFILHIRTQAHSKKEGKDDPWLMPGATATRSLSNRQAGLRLLQSRTSASETQVRQFYRNRFTEAGWSLHLGDGRQAPDGGEMYIKNGKLGLLRVNSTGQDRLTHITMMQQSTGGLYP